jgi:predicted nucleic acid-binding protein
MAFTVIYDANVLFPAPLRDLLVGIAQTGTVRARWTEQILDECFRNILAQRPDLDESRLRRTRELMNRAVRDVIVSGHEGLLPDLVLPDPDDRHVLAAAVRAGAQVIVTFNLKDFPDTALEPLGLEARHPDEFVLEVIHLAPGAVAAVLVEQARRLKNPPMTLTQLIEVLGSQGLVQSSARLRELFSTMT